MSNLNSELKRINGQINLWQAFEWALFGLAGLAACWFVLAVLDLVLRPRGNIRLVFPLLLLAAGVVLVVFLRRVLVRQRTTAAVAALLEGRFPQLDNHLINRVLFAAVAGAASPWLRNYLHTPIPGWRELPLRELKNRRLRRFGAVAVGVAMLLIAVPAMIYGEAWTIALQRAANPFCGLTPPTFAQVIAVEPGNTTVVQGMPLELTVRARGRSGQTVLLEMTPSDDVRTVIQLGSFDATDAERVFSHSIARLSAPVSYRFRVGDAWPTDTFTVTTVAPLAVAGLQLNITPPPYTRKAPTVANLLEEAPDIPSGATATLLLTLNRAAQRAELSLAGGESMAMRVVAGGNGWQANLAITSGAAINLTAVDNLNTRLVHNARYTLVPDLPPTLRITAPTGKAVLPAGAAPYIAFTATDDYGLSAIVLERVKRGSKPDSPGEEIARWSTAGERSFNGEWEGNLSHLGHDAALRLIVYDNMEPGPPNVALSREITFEQVLITEQYKEHLTRKGEAQKSLGQLIQQQRGNMVETARLMAALPSFDPFAWESPLNRQREIRSYGADLLRGGGASLGTARVALEKAGAPMAEAIAQLARMTAIPPESRSRAANEALTTQRLILRLLTVSQNESKARQLDQSSSGMMAIVNALIKEQTATLNITKTVAQNSSEVPEAVTGRQESLALDLAGMIELARRDAGMAGEDDPLRTLLSSLADRAEELRIRVDMLRAAQALQNDQPQRALTPQIGATNSLHTLRLLLSEWQAEEGEKKEVAALDTVRDARDAMKKLEKLQEGIVDALRATESQGNKTDGSDDELLEEVVELKKMMADAALKVATDLQALPELDAANELVTDCYQIYEAMGQLEGTEKDTDAIELGLQKEDFWLELMAQTGQKLDEMEHWLANKPDDHKRNVENFDQAEIQNAIPQIGMPEELQDLIGDLMEEQEELADKTDDSLTNQGDANPALGWEIAEGETVDYSAAGKSGNRKPDHKEQDGRSQVGRAGMADGEVMAKTGRINEGDDEIDKRRTRDSSQSGDIEEEGHEEAKATGGGKNSGYADEKGMAGTEADARRESKVRQADETSMQAELAQIADTIYARAQLSGLRIPAGFNSARENMKRAAEAGKAGQILQMREFQSRAIQELSRARSSFDGGFSDKTMGANADSGRSPDANVASNPDEAPAEYRQMVSDYFKAIGEME